MGWGRPVGTAKQHCSDSRVVRSGVVGTKQTQPGSVIKKERSQRKPEEETGEEEGESEASRVRTEDPAPSPGQQDERPGIPEEEGNRDQLPGAAKETVEAREEQNVAARERADGFGSGEIGDSNDPPSESVPLPVPLDTRSISEPGTERPSEPQFVPIPSGSEPHAPSVSGPLTKRVSRPKRTPDAPPRRLESDEEPREPGEPWRFGARRHYEGPPSGGGSAESGVAPPELRCRREGQEWGIFLIVAPDLGVTRVCCGEEELIEQDGEYRVPRFSGALSLTGDNGESKTIPLLDGEAPLLFLLSGSEDRLRGRQCRRVTAGRFLAIAPHHWPRPGGEFREREQCLDRDFVAHFMNSSWRDAPESLGSIGNWRPGVDRSASLDGTHLFDNSDDGELFFGGPPKLKPTEGIEWARVGDEHPNGWKGQNFRVMERSLAQVLAGKQGRFFLRTYPSGQVTLADSTAFRYWPDIEQIQVNGQPLREDLVLPPPEEHHHRDTVRLVGRNGTLRPEVCSHRARRLDSGAVEVEPNPEADEIRLLLREGTSEVNVVVNLPRVWWRLSGEADWTDQPTRLTRTEFRKPGVGLDVLTPANVASPTVSLEGTDLRSFPGARADGFPSKRRWVIPLREFDDDAALDSDMSEECALRLHFPNCDPIVLCCVLPETAGAPTQPQTEPLAEDAVAGPDAVAEVAESANSTGNGSAPAQDGAPSALSAEAVSVEEAAEFEAFLDQYQTHMVEGDIVTGTILHMTDSDVIVDVGYKSEGIIPLDEFRDVDGNVRIREGDEIDVLVQRADNRRGHLVLSHRKAEKMKVWNQIEDAFEKQTPVRGRVVDRIRGGLEVDIGEIGVRGFLPGSQVDLRPVRNLGSYKGRELELRVIKLNKRRGNIVLSRRVVLEEEKTKTLAALEVGRVFRGEVRDLTEYGAFVDIGGICGLLHIREMSFRRLEHPSELMKVGDQIEVVILRSDAEAERVSLGYKQLNVDPWTTAHERYAVGTRVRGKVVSITDYGAFIEMEPGVEGLIHVSEMSWSSRTKHPSKLLAKGDFVEAMVLRVDFKSRRISLGLKQVEPNPWPRLAEQYPIGSRLTGTVRKFTDFGAFVEVDSSIDGLIHISDLSWNKRVNHPSEVLNVGDEVETVVLSIDPENRRLSLGLKQLSDDAWEGFFTRHQEGDLVDGTVIRFADFGAFVQIEEGIEGLLRLNDIDEPPPSKAEERLHLGQPLKLRIVRLSRDDRKVGLSLRAAEEGDSGHGDSGHGESGGEVSVKIGDVWKR